MNKISQTVTYLDHLHKKPGKYTIGRLFSNQEASLCWAVSKDGYWRGYDAILKKHGITRKEWQAQLSEPVLSFFTGPPPKYWEVNKELTRYCRSYGVLIITRQRNAFADEAKNAANRGTVFREKNKEGRWVYFNKKT